MILDRCSTPIGLLLSGGLDSCVLLGRLLSEGHRVQPFYVRSDLVWQPEELDSARRFCKAVRCGALEHLVVLEMPLRDLYGEHWSVTGQETPDSSSPDDTVYLPGRNALLTIKAAVWCGMHGVDRLALAVLGSSPFRYHKAQVMDLGRGLPLELTFSCIAPSGGMHCGRCNKCAERIAAFRLIGAEDPTRYAVEVVAPPR
jgi:7-cyano-7-deazaguanine synthase